MSKRMRELADKAGYYIDPDFDIEFEELAELIVKECIEQVWYTREDGINGNVSEVIKERMKQHFEVEP